MLRRPGGAVDVRGAAERFPDGADRASWSPPARANGSTWLRADPGPRAAHARLRGAADHDVWLESWLPGRGTGWHDHGGSAGVMVVMRGELEERIPVLGGVVTQIRRIPGGRGPGRWAGARCTSWPTSSLRPRAQRARLLAAAGSDPRLRDRRQGPPAISGRPASQQAEPLRGRLTGPAANSGRLPSPRGPGGGLVRVTAG